MFKQRILDSEIIDVFVLKPMTIDASHKNVQG